MTDVGSVCEGRSDCRWSGSGRLGHAIGRRTAILGRRAGETGARRRPGALTGRHGADPGRSGRSRQTRRRGGGLRSGTTAEVQRRPGRRRILVSPSTGCRVPRRRRCAALRYQRHFLRHVAHRLRTLRLLLQRAATLFHLTIQLWKTHTHTHTHTHTTN